MMSFVVVKKRISDWSNWSSDWNLLCLRKITADHLKIFYLSSERWKANLNVRSKNARVHVKNLTDEPVSTSRSWFKHLINACSQPHWLVQPDPSLSSLLVLMLCLIPFHQFMCSGHMTWVSKKDINGMEFMDGLTFLGLSLCAALLFLLCLLTFVSNLRHS